MPNEQKKLIAAVEKARPAFRSGTNDTEQGEARTARAQDICSALPSMTVSHWVGQVSALLFNNAGKGILSIKIAKDAYVKTWNNAYSDRTAQTLIEPKSIMFAKASALEVGQWVTFSGSFYHAEPDCIQESSMTLQGSLTEPEFIFQFSDIQALSRPSKSNVRF